MTLRSRLIAAAVVLVAVLVAVGVVLVRTVEASELAQTDQELKSVTPVALGLAERLLTGSELHRPVSASDGPLSDAYVAVLSGGKRRTVAAADDVVGRSPVTPSAISSPPPAAMHPVTVDSVTGSGQWRAVLMKTKSGDEVLVAISTSQMDATAHRLRVAVYVTGALVALVLLASAFWLERLGLRPINEVEEVASAVLAGDRSRRVPSTGSGTESDQLARALNLMLDNQQAVEARLRQFVADASHELRTPTSVISGVAQLWRDGELRGGEALEDAMRRVGQESSRIGSLVEELLLLARLDEGSPLQQTRVDVAEVIGEVLQAGQATHPSRSVGCELGDELVVTGDRPALYRVVSNLVTNALVHTPTGSRLDVRARRTATTVVIEVADGGPGLNADDADHAFDRFWRGHDSRGRPGSGLGLAIVAAIVSAQRGQVTMDTGPDRGTTVRVVLPAADAQES